MTRTAAAGATARDDGGTSSSASSATAADATAAAPPPPPPPTAIADLGAALLAHEVLPRLAPADVRRAARACRVLRAAAAGVLPALALDGAAIESGEADAALLAAAAAAAPSSGGGGGRRGATKLLRLRGAHLDVELGAWLASSHAALLAQLRRLELVDVAGLPMEGLAGVLAAAPLLEELRTHGSWWWAAEPPPPPPQRPKAKATRLRRLALLRNDAVSDGGGGGGSLRAWLASCCPLLEALDLSGCGQVGGGRLGALLAPLAATLTSLTLSSCIRVTNAAIQELAAAAAAAAAATTPQARPQREGPQEEGLPLPPPPPLPRLVALDLSYTRVSDAGMRPLRAAFPALRRVNLKGTNVGDDGLAALFAVTPPAAADAASSCGGEGLVGAALNLERLDIKHAHRVTDEGLAWAAAGAAAAAGAGAGGGAVTAATTTTTTGPLAGLRALSFGYTSMPDADAMAADITRACPRLTALDLLAAELTDAGLLALGRGLPLLRDLRLYQAAVTPAGLAAFAAALDHHHNSGGSGGLTSLVLYGLALPGLGCLSAFSQLRRLQLGGLGHLAAPPAALAVEVGALPRLETLTLEGIDGVTRDALLRLMSARRRTLRDVRMRGCDGAGLQALEAVAAAAASAEVRSSATVWHAASASADTDDEEDGWEVVPA